MNRDRFQDLLDSHGSDLLAWPVADRIAAERLIASDPTAAEAFEEARRLDRLIQHSLTSGQFGGGNEEIASRILAGLPRKLPAQQTLNTKAPVQARPTRQKPKPWAFLPAQGALLPRVAALSFAAALGVAVGLFWAQQSMVARQAAAPEEASADVTAVLFQTDTSIGTF
jgi:hypothetical protein